MCRYRWFLLFVAVWLAWTTALSAATHATFFPATASGCFVQEGDKWLPVPNKKVNCIDGVRLKTTDRGWGTLEVTCGTVVVKPNSVIYAKQSGLILESGKFRAFIRHAPGAFKFRLPAATLGVYGTIFSAQAPNGVSVEAGVVEVAPDHGSPVQLTQNQTWGVIDNNNDGDSFERSDVPVDQTTRLLEEALTDQHDGRFQQAAEKFFSLRSDPSTRQAADFHDTLTRSFLETVSQANLEPGHPLLLAAVKLVRAEPQRYFAILEDSLCNASHGLAEALVQLGEKAGPDVTRDQRYAIARELGELTSKAASADNVEADNTPIEATKAVSDDKPAASNTDTRHKPDQALEPFWRDSSIFLNMLQNPERVPPAQIVQVLQPSSLALLSKAAQKERLQSITRISPDLLAAQGLFLLVQALLAVDKHEDAQKVLSGSFRLKYGKTPQFQQALSLLRITKQKKDMEKEEAASDEEQEPEAPTGATPRSATSLNQAF